MEPEGVLVWNGPGGGDSWQPTCAGVRHGALGSEEKREGASLRGYVASRKRNLD